MIEAIRKINILTETILEMDRYIKGSLDIRKDGTLSQTLRITPDPRSVRKYRKEISHLLSEVKQLATGIDSAN